MLDTAPSLLPNITPALEKFSALIVWKKVGNKKVPEPAPGLDAGFDEANEHITILKE